MPINRPPRPVTVQDIVNSDERVIQLKKTYEEFQNKKNEFILEISRVEADIIAKMGAFEYLNNYAPEDTKEAKEELLPDFRALVTKKRKLIDEIKAQDKGMEDTVKTYQVLAQEIVKELQKQISPSASCPESAESCPESAPDDICACGECHGECKGHNDTPNA